MDPIRADEHVRHDRLQRRSGGVDEPRRDVLMVLVKPRQAVAGHDRLRAPPLDHRVLENALQRAAVDRELRHLIPRVEPSQLAPDLLPEAVHVDQLVGAQSDRVQPLEQAELGELADRVRQRVDPDAEFADLRRLLEHAALDPTAIERQGGCESSDSPTDNENARPHSVSLRSGQ